MPPHTILVVEDEKPIRDMLAFGLKRAGFGVIETATCNEALERLEENRPDLVLVDWMLPDCSGLELTESLRRNPAYSDIPIIMVTARATEDDKVRGLGTGADDYITKPFSQRELQARIRAVLRRTPAAIPDEVIEIAGLALDAASHRVTAGDEELSLGPTEFRLLKFFMMHTERVYSRSQLIDAVWGNNVYIEERTVDVHIRRLRKALAGGGHDRFLATVRGSGYRFSASESS